MRHLFPIVIVAAVVGLSSGCMTGMPTVEGDSANASLTEVVAPNSASCCSSLEQLPYQPLAPGFEGELVLDTASPVYNFAEGSSYFAAYKLPETGAGSVVKLRSLVVKGRVFKPSVVLLNSRFQPVRAFNSAAFPYVPARGFTADSFYGEFALRQSYAGHPDNEAYLIIYSTGEQQAGETTLLHPAKAYAKAKGIEPPNVPDPIARHSAGGRLQLTLTSGSPQSLGEQLLKPLTGNTAAPSTALAAPVPVAQEAPLVVLPETEAYYRQQIDSALASDDLDRALQLAEEARRIGAVKVREYLLQKLQVR